MRRALGVLLVAALAAPAGPAAGASGGPRAVPARPALRSAVAYARHRRGVVSFAVISSRGRLRGLDATRHYRAASLTKAMLLVAFLRRLGPRDVPAADRRLLGPMIRRSDNRAASAIYARLGDPPLVRLARKARMTGFGPAGAWSEARITAADQARFFRRWRALVPPRHRSYARALLGGVVGEQRWGVPAGMPAGWTAEFKGGWRRVLVHQAARLQHGHRVIALAVLTDANPSQAYGRATIAGITRRLLAEPAAARRARSRAAALAPLGRVVPGEPAV